MLDLVNCPTPKGTTQIITHIAPDYETKFIQACDAQGNIIAALFWHNKDMFASLPPETQWIQKFPDRVALIGENKKEISVLPLDKVEPQILNSMEQIQTACLQKQKP